MIGLLAFPYTMAFGLVGLAGLLTPDGVGFDKWLHPTSFNIFSRHMMNDVFKVW